MDTVVIPGDRVRVPNLRPGTAAAVHRYDKERAFMLHPDDFHRLTALEELAAAALTISPIEFSHVAVEAHRDESTPGQSITNPDELLALLGE
jgi:hypothetical protein